MIQSNEYKQFRQSEPLRAALIQQLGTNEMKAAISAVESCARPLMLPNPVPGQAYDITIAHHYHEMLGMNRAFQMLRSLCNPPGKDTLIDDDEEFIHALPKEFQQ